MKLKWDPWTENLTSIEVTSAKFDVGDHEHILLLISHSRFSGNWTIIIHGQRDKIHGEHWTADTSAEEKVNAMAKAEHVLRLYLRQKREMYAKAEGEMS